MVGFLEEKFFSDLIRFSLNVFKILLLLVCENIWPSISDRNFIWIVNRLEIQAEQYKKP